MLEHRIEEFQGGIATKKYITRIKNSNVPATRNVQGMVEEPYVRPIGAGKEVH